MERLILIFLITISYQMLAQQANDSLLITLKNQYTLSEYDKPFEVVRFNEDTILIAGYLAEPVNSATHFSQTKNIVYRTLNGGENWQKIKFSGNAWIYTTHHNLDGEIWMGGSDEYIHYSPNYGASWIRKRKPFNPSNRVHSIFMVNSRNGIAGGLHNGLAITNDNWNNATQIESPLDQSKFSILANSSRDRVDKVALLGSIVLINQNDHFYYTKANLINWKEFSIPVIDFEVSIEENEVTLVSLNGKHFVLDQNLELQRTYFEEDMWIRYVPDNSYLDVHDFTKEGIKSIEITSTNWVAEAPVHMYTPSTAKIEKAKVSCRSNECTLKAKGAKKKVIYPDSIAFEGSFQKSEINYNFDRIVDNLVFTEEDYIDYQKVYQKEVRIREENKVWGGDFTYKISLNSKYFQAPEGFVTHIDQTKIQSIFNLIYNPFISGSERDNIALKILTNDGTLVTLTNENSVIYSLPWTIEVKGQKVESFNPRITAFVRTIFPESFNNYNMLLGGELLFELAREFAIEGIDYKTATNKH